MNEKRKAFYAKLDAHLEEWTALIAHMQDLTSAAQADGSNPRRPPVGA